MDMKIGLHLRQRQQLVMTPKLQQALKLLQMPSIELQQMLKQEIMENPLLEEIEDFEEIVEDEKEASEGKEEEPAPAQEETDDAKPDGGEAGEEQVDWDEYFNAGFELGRAGGEEEQQEEFFEKVPVAKQSFTDLLMGQLRIATDDAKTLVIGDYMIGSLDESGYLTCSIEEIADTFDVSLEDVDRVLELIQSFDPPGVGARNLQECLLLQLRFRGEEDSLAAKIIGEHFEEFKQKKYMEIARKLKVSVQDIQEQCKQIATLDPKPGLEVVVEDPKYVIPDLVVETVDGKYVVYLNDRNVPRLRVSQHYHDELMREVRNGDNEAREFINARLKSAKWLIQTIEQRRRTMVKVMECIVRKQREFFDKGTAFLRPLTLQQVAQRDRHARVDREPRDDEQVRADATRRVRAQVFLLVQSGDPGRGRGFGQERQGPYPPDHRGGKRPDAAFRPEDRRYTQENRAQYRSPNRSQVPGAVEYTPRPDA